MKSRVCVPRSILADVSDSHAALLGRHMIPVVHLDRSKHTLRPWRMFRNVSVAISTDRMGHLQVAGSPGTSGGSPRLSCFSMNLRSRGGPAGPREQPSKILGAIFGGGTEVSSLSEVQPSQTRHVAFRPSIEMSNPYLVPWSGTQNVTASSCTACPSEIFCSMQLNIYSWSR